METGSTHERQARPRRSGVSGALYMFGSVSVAAVLLVGCNDATSSAGGELSDASDAIQEQESSASDDTAGTDPSGDADFSNRSEYPQGAYPEDYGSAESGGSSDDGGDENSGSSDGLQIGDSFEDTCTIAWPTAPSRGSQGTQIRTTCSGVDMGDFQFVDILVLDPDLDVSPSDSTVAVRGEVVDVVESEFGFKTLAVIADEAEVR